MTARFDPARRPCGPRRSAICVGRLAHRRLRPRQHAFGYRIYHALIDLDELDDLDRDVAGFGHNRRALTTFHDRDHLGPRDEPVADKLAGWLARQGAALPTGPVLLLTNLRVLGYVFNPVSWFFCHDADGELELIVAEVSNTFGESYAYLLDDLEPVDGGALRARRQKRFHVSPFLGVDDHDYTFTIRPPALDPRARDPLAVRMAVADPDGKLFDATLVERARPLDTRTLRAVLLSHPLMTLHTIVAIHFQALRLWAKRVGVHRKPGPPDSGFDAATGQASASRSAPNDA